MSWAATRFVRWSVAWHGLAVAFGAIFPSLWRLALTAVVLDQLAITAACVWPRSRLLGPNIRRLPGRHAAGTIGLTFDDGPDPGVTPRVADILDRYSATATFFCIGAKVEQHPEIVRGLVARGHSVENHTQSHPNLFGLLGPQAAAREIAGGQSAITRSVGVAPSYFRAPVGIRAPWTQHLLEVHGLRLVSWTRRGFDTVARDPDQVVSRLTRGIEGGDILLLHDTSAARDPAGEPIVLTVLPRLLDRLAACGLRAAALPRELPA